MAKGGIRIMYTYDYFICSKRDCVCRIKLLMLFYWVQIVKLRRRTKETNFVPWIERSGWGVYHELYILITLWSLRIYMTHKGHDTNTVPKGEIEIVYEF